MLRAWFLENIHSKSYEFHVGGMWSLWDNPCGAIRTMNYWRQIYVLRMPDPRRPHWWRMTEVSPLVKQTNNGCNMYCHENNQALLEIETIWRNDVDEQIIDSDWSKRSNTTAIRWFIFSCSIAFSRTHMWNWFPPPSIFTCSFDGRSTWHMAWPGADTRDHTIKGP